MNITVIGEPKDKLVLPELAHGLLQKFLNQNLNQIHPVNEKKKGASIYTHVHQD